MSLLAFFMTTSDTETVWPALSGVSTRPAPSTASVNGSGLSETPERNRSAMEPAAYLENAGNNLLVFGLHVSLGVVHNRPVLGNTDNRDPAAG